MMTLLRVNDVVVQHDLAASAGGRKMSFLILDTHMQPLLA